jgi:hypothetical protein
MITITIDTESAAFEDNPEAEVKRILETVYLRDGWKLRDINGNTVGQVTIEEPEMDCLHSFDDDDPMAICKTCGVIRATVRGKQYEND